MSDTPLDSLAVVISSIAILVALYQASVTRHESRTTIATTLYKGYLDWAMAHPEFALVSTDSTGIRFQKIRSNEMEYVRYDFYVSNLLFAAESILEIMHNDVNWIATLRDQLSYHTEYLQQDEFDRAHYSAKLQQLIDQVLGSDQPVDSAYDSSRSAGS